MNILFLVALLINFPCAAAYFTKDAVGKIWTINSTVEVTGFFNTTYLERLGGAWDLKKKRYAVPGYINGWEMFHGHHVCIREGTDGLYFGMVGQENSWSHMLNKKKRIVSEEDYHKYAKIRGLLPLHPLRLHYKGIVNMTMRHGSTLLINCFHQHIKSSNPAHWMMKLGVLYETALCQSNNNKTNIFDNLQMKLPYNHVQMAQCSLPMLSDWRWGENMWEIIKHRSDLAGMTDNNTQYDTVGWAKLPDIPHDHLTCFEDVYFSARMGLWMQGRANLVQFRRDTYTVSHEPREAETNPEKLNLVHGFDDGNYQKFHMPYCNALASNITNSNSALNASIPAARNISSARILIFQRTSTTMLRKFVNLDEVVSLAQEYTILPVKVVTVNESTTVQDQIRLFNNFDILITSHGSHLANGLFTMNPETKGVVEVVSSVFDSVFYGNYNHWLGFSDYIMSSGHLTPGAPAVKSFYFGDTCPFQTQSDFLKHNCNDTKQDLRQFKNKIQQTWKICHDHLQTRACNTLVNITILRGHLDMLFDQALCRIAPDPIIQNPIDLKKAMDAGQSAGAAAKPKTWPSGAKVVAGKTVVTPSAAAPVVDEPILDPNEFHRI